MLRWIILCAVAAAVMAGPAARGQGLLPPHADQRTLHREYLAAAAEYEREAILRGYLERSGGRSDALVERFAEQYAALVVGAGEVRREDVIVLARELLQRGVQEPAVLAMCGSAVLEANRRSPPAARALRAGIEGLPPGAAAPHLRIAAARVRHHQIGAATPRVVRAAAENIEAALSEPDLAPLVERWIVQQTGAILEGMDAEGAALAAQVVEGSPGVSPWAAHMVSGMVQRRLAWEVRGTRENRITPRRAATEFAAHMAEARRRFAAAWELDPSRPEAASEMIGVAMGEGAVDEMRLWFSRAVTAQFDYMPAYFNYTLGLRPRWHGSIDELLAFGEACAATGRFDTPVPGMLPHAMAEASAESRDYGALWRRPGVYRSLRGVLEQLAAQAPDERSADAWRAWIPAIAWRAAEHQDAADALERVRWPEGEELPRWARTELDEIRSDAPLFASDLKRVRQGLIAERRRKWEEAFEAFGEASRDPAAAGDMQLQWALADRDRRNRFRHALERGEEARVGVTNLVGWRRVSGDWRVDNSTMVGRARGAGAQIFFAEPLGDRYMLEALVGIDEDPENPEIAVGMILDWDPDQPVDPQFDSVRLSAQDVRVGFREGTEGRLRRIQTPVARLRVERDREHLKVWVGNHLMHDGPIGGARPRSGRFGFGIFGAAASDAEVRIRMIMARRLD